MMSKSNAKESKSNAKDELQRKVDAKREEIADKVDQIRSTLTDEVHERKQALHDAMDWRYYVKKQPVACAGGVMAVGFFLGSMLAKKAVQMASEHHNPDWRERAYGLMSDAEHKVDQWRGKTGHVESNWRSRSRSAFSSTSDLVFRELAKTAQQMIIPTVVAAITGKMASDNKTTVVEKNVQKGTPGQPDQEYTTGVTEVVDGEVKKSVGTQPSVSKADDAADDAKAM